MKVDSAKGYYASLKRKGIMDSADDRANIAALEDTFRQYQEVARQDNLSGDARDNFFFWHGAQVGNYLISRAYLQHYSKLKHEQMGDEKSDA